MAKKTELEQNLQNEPNQAAIDAETARRLLEGKAKQDEKKNGK